MQKQENDPSESTVSITESLSDIPVEINLLLTGEIRQPHVSEQRDAVGLK